MTEVAFRPMTAEEYVAWPEVITTTYSEAIAEASRLTVDEVRPRAVEQLEQLLPDGIETAGVWLLNVLDDHGSVVGKLWIGRHPARPATAYIYDIEIEPQRRGEGWARKALTAAETLVKDAGLTAIGLNVFGHTTQARRLYESLGYETEAIQMLKELAAEG